MLNICSFIQKFFGYIKTVSKKMYRTGLVVMAGAVLFAIVAMNSNSFNGAGKNRGTDSDGGALQESADEGDDTDETAEIQPESYKLQGLTTFLQEENNSSKESEPIASLIAAVDREHVGVSNYTKSNQSEMEQGIQLLVDAHMKFYGTAKTYLSAEEETTQITEPQTDPVIETEESQTQTEIQTEIETEIETTQELQETKAAQNYNVVNFDITDEDYYWLIRIVETEAGDQDEIGRILVANVIFNRVRSGTFPGTVKGVIFQNNGRTYQFEPVKNERIYNTTPSQTTIDCVGRAMAGEDYSSGALYFTMRTSSNSWFNRELNLLFVHGDHYFYSN